MKAFRSYFGNGSLYGDMVWCEDLFDEICFDMDNDNAGLLPVDSGTYGSEVFSLAQIVKRKLNSVVDVTEFIYVIEAQLNR